MTITKVDSGEKYKKKVLLIADALVEALESQAKVHDPYIDTFLKQHKGKHSASDKNIIQQAILSAYFQRINMYRQRGYDTSLGTSIARSFEKYQKLQSKFTYLCSPDAIKSDNTQVNLVNEYFLNVFEKDDAMIKLRESFVYFLLLKVLANDELKWGFFEIIFNEVLAIDTHFLLKGLGGIANVSTSLDFSKVMTLVKNAMDPSIHNSFVESVFTELTDAIASYQSCSMDEVYRTNKDQEISIAKTALKKVSTVCGLNQLYQYSKNYVNKHKHPWVDAILGKANTKSWQSFAATLREKALFQLKIEMYHLNTPEEKKSYLLEARKLPVFSEHRSNYIVTGAFFRTATIKKIDQLIDRLKATENKNEKVPLVI